MKLKQALVIPAKIATMTLATIVCSAPGFLYRIGMTYNRLPDAEEWLGFLAISAIAGGIFSTLAVSIEHLYPTLLQKYKAHQLKTRLSELKTNLNKAGSLYKELNLKYGTTIQLDRAAFDDMVKNNSDLLSQLKAINKGLKELRRELKRLQLTLGKNHNYPDVNDFNEIITIDQSLDQMDALIRRADFRNPPRYGLAVEIDNQIFGKGSANCLTRLTFNKNLYIGRIPALMEKKAQIEKLLPNYDVIIGMKNYEAMDRYTSGTVSMVIINKETREIVDEITILDEFGNGTAHGLSPKVPLPENSENYKWFGETESLGIHIATLLGEYMKLANGTFDQAMKLVKTATRDPNHPLANMSETQRLELRRLLRQMGIKPKWVGRVQQNFPNFIFAEGPITYVFDLLELIAFSHKKDVMINIGYGQNELTGKPDDLLLIFEVTNPALLMEPSVESLHKAFMDMVERADNIVQHGPKDPGFQNSYAYTNIENFKDILEDLEIVLNKKARKNLTRGEFFKRIKEIITKLNTRPFTDKYPPDAYVVNDLGDAPKPGRIELYEKAYNNNPMLLAEDEDYLVLKILNDYLSTYGQYTNNGYTLTVLGNKGFGEYHLHVDYKSSPAQLIRGYIEKKDGIKYYPLNKFIDK